MRGVWLLLTVLLVLSRAGALPATSQPGVSRGGEDDPELPTGGPMSVKIQVFPILRAKGPCGYYRWVNGKKVYFTRPGCHSALFSFRTYKGPHSAGGVWR